MSDPTHSRPELTLGTDNEPVSVSPGQLVSVSVTAIDFEVNPDFDFEGPDVFYNPEVRDQSVIGVDNGSICSATLEIMWGPTDPEIEKFEAPFDLTLTVFAEFMWDEGFSEDDRLGWTGLNGLYLLWPYLRSYVTNITSLSHLPSLTLPTVVVPGASVRFSDE